VTAVPSNHRPYGSGRLSLGATPPTSVPWMVPAAPLGRGRELEDRMATITTTAVGDKSFESIVGHHRIVTDVPAAMGGQDRGLEPAQLFIVSLGSCVATLVQEYCDHHDVDARDLRVDVDFERAVQPSRLRRIRVRIAVPHADLTSERLRTILQRVAEHCPVHETISTMDAIEFEFEGERGVGD
jgi:putative redox protein